MSGINFDLVPADKPRRRGRPSRSPSQAKSVREAKSSQAKLNGPINGRADLGSWLWGAADILRGAVSPDDYVDFVVPLLFYKRLSDSYQDEYRKTLAEYKDEKVARSPMFHKAQIPNARAPLAHRKCLLLPDGRTRKTSPKQSSLVEGSRRN